VEAGYVGVVIGPAPQGRATIVEFGGIQTIITNQRLMRATDKPLGKKRGRKKQGSATPISSNLSKSESANKIASGSKDEISTQLITQMANTLLLHGGLREHGDNHIQLQFADLPESVQINIRALIKSKLAPGTTNR
jgi:hypothetical protein